MNLDEFLDECNHHSKESAYRKMIADCPECTANLIKVNELTSENSSLKLLICDLRKTQEIQKSKESETHEKPAVPSGNELPRPGDGTSY